MTTKPCHCGEEKCMYEVDVEPCYGDIRPIAAEEYEGPGYVETYFKHACEGHKNHGRYVPE